MATSATGMVYIRVIEDVISKVRDEFVNNGPGESVLNELQGVINFTFLTLISIFLFYYLIFYFPIMNFELSKMMIYFLRYFMVLLDLISLGF